jgi:hypothetical protein
MDFISNSQELVENIKTLENYLKNGNSEENEFSLERVRLGKTICVYKVDGINHFAPSRFVGYKSNTMNKHLAYELKDGRETNPIIDKIVGKSFENQTIEKKFIEYTKDLGLEVPNNKRRFWRLKDKNGKNLNIEL